MPCLRHHLPNRFNGFKPTGDLLSLLLLLLLLLVLLLLLLLPHGRIYCRYCRRRTCCCCCCCCNLLLLLLLAEEGTAVGRTCYKQIDVRAIAAALEIADVLFVAEHA
jgi:hypothetical protein